MSAIRTSFPIAGPFGPALLLPVLLLDATIFPTGEEPDA